jgi:cysteine desulfurase
MAENRAYLDWNASAPLLSEARAAMVAALDTGANASSVHAEGRTARRLIEAARRDVAALVGARPEHVVFASGATEAATTLLTPDWRTGRAPLIMSRLYVSRADHPCTLSGGRFAPERVVRFGVGRDGVIDLEALELVLAAHDRTEGLPLVALHAANNETGVVQPVAEAMALTKAAGGVLVVDAVQAAGRIPVDVSKNYADYLILSSHKIGGPQGAGAIVSVSDVMMPAPLVTGGGQEKGFRAGTENVAAIAGFGAAARVARERLAAMADVKAMRERIEKIIRAAAPDATIYGESAERLPNTVFFAVPGLKAETGQIALDLDGVALSAGSACSSGRVGPSHVLQAMGFGDDAGGLRVSIGPSTSEADIDRFENALTRLVARLTASRSRAA